MKTPQHLVRKVHAGHSGDLEHVTFSLAYMTANKAHDLSWFQKHPGGNEARWLVHLLENMEFWSQNSWNSLSRLDRKDRGFEKIGVDELKSDITDRIRSVCPVDELIIFRFGKDCRMAGVRWAENTGVFQVLGFDFDFTLYDHGS